MAVARKLTVAVWHVLMGHWNKALEENSTLLTKLNKLATDLGVPTLKELGYASMPVAHRWRFRSIYFSHWHLGVTVAEFL